MGQLCGKEFHDRPTKLRHLRRVHAVDSDAPHALGREFHGAGVDEQVTPDAKSHSRSQKSLPKPKVMPPRASPAGHEAGPKSPDSAKPPRVCRAALRLSLAPRAPSGWGTTCGASTSTSLQVT